MENLAAYSGWIGHRNIGDEAIYQAIQRLLPELEFSDIDHTGTRNPIIYGGGTVLPSVVSRESDYHNDAFTAVVGAGARNPAFWNQRFSPLDFGYYTGSAVNSNRVSANLFDDVFYQTTKFIDSLWSYNKTLTYRDFEAVREADIDFLGVRGPDTSVLLDQYEIEHEVVGDTALILEPSSYDSESSKLRIGVTIRDNTYGWATNEYHNEVVDFCAEHADEYEFVFLPFWPPDIEVCIDAARQVPGADFCDYCSRVNVQGVIDELAECDVVIADKLHTNVLSACSYTPFISLEYRPKNLDFAKSVGMEKFNKRTDEIDAAWLTERVECIRDSDDQQQTIRKNVNSHRESLRDFTRRIAEHLPIR